jgi:hypothetical protein
MVDQLYDRVDPKIEVLAAIREANEAISGLNGNPTIGYVNRAELVVEVEPDEDELQQETEPCTPRHHSVLRMHRHTKCNTCGRELYYNG